MYNICRPIKEWDSCACRLISYLLLTGLTEFCIGCQNESINIVIVLTASMCLIHRTTRWTCMGNEGIHPLVCNLDSINSSNQVPLCSLGRKLDAV
jgi:hypothetical protein